MVCSRAVDRADRAVAAHPRQQGVWSFIIIAAHLRLVFSGQCPVFHYDWKKEAWNLFFVSGILIGGFVAAAFLGSGNPVEVDDNLRQELAAYGVTNIDSLVPSDIFSFANLFTLQGFLMIVVGGFLVGFGTRWAGGCTSGHAIMGLSNLQMPSLIATCCFMIGGFIMANLILPYILNL